MRLQYLDMGNQCSPLLKLPGELRNIVYEFAIPQDEVFDSRGITGIRIEGTNGGVTQPCTSIEKEESHKQVFGITQVCLQLRKETLPLMYSSNVFMLHVREQRGNIEWRRRVKLYPCKVGKGEDWIESRPLEALLSLSRIILFLHPWSRNRGQPDTALFVMSDAVAVASVQHRLEFRLQVEDSDPDLASFCRRWEEAGRGSNASDVSGAPMNVESQHDVGGKLLKLIQELRDGFCNGKKSV